MEVTEIMKKVLIIPFFLLSVSTSAQEHGWGTEIAGDDGRLLKIGGRIQAIAEEDSETGGQDFYLRRVRVNLKYNPWENHVFVYDIRNDNANREDQGEGEFSTGDAYWKIDLEKQWINNIKLFRGKVDVSYSQTSSSKHLFEPNRPQVTEKAANFVVHNRRAANFQVNGNLSRLYFHFAVSDGVQSDELEPLSGTAVVERVSSQKFSYGGKVRYFFIGDAEDNYVQDTFYGSHNTFSLGLGYFRNDRINLLLSGNRELSIERSLLNAELSYSLNSFRFLAEYFSFKGDLINLDAGEESNATGDSGGYYAQAEYVFGKVAPFVGYESFDRREEEDGHAEETLYGGVNYYDLMDARRYGIVYKKTEKESRLGDNDERFYAHIMVNF